MKVVSFFTTGTPYELEAISLRESLISVGHEYLIEGIEPKSTWVENCAMKGKFIRDKFNQNDDNLWWLDADSILLQALPDLSNADIAAHIRPDGNLASGAVFFRQSTVTKKILQKWVEYCELYPLVWDQLSLLIAIYNVSRIQPVSLKNLPDTYCKKAPRSGVSAFKCKLYEMLKLKSKPIIQQNMASRRLKSSFSKPNYEITFNNLCLAHRTALKSFDGDKINMTDVIEKAKK